MNRIIQLLWPESCVLCGRPDRGGLCPECARKEKMFRIGKTACFKCGKPMEHERLEYCGDCRKTEHLYTQGAGLWIYNEMSRRAVYRFKNQNQRCSAKVFARLILDQCQMRLQRWKPDVIVPIPLHKKKHRSRGFNQAELLAAEISEGTGIPMDTEILKRRNETMEQKKMNVQSRKANMKNAFALCKEIKRGTRILLVDDVYTTGNTMDAAAGVLVRGGAKEVFFLTICIGQGY